MTVIPASAIAKRAELHLGESSPDNTCVSQGMNRWPVELGLPGIDTASVSEARKLAHAGHNGWRYHTGTEGIEVGNFLDWDPEVLGDAADAHVSCLVDIDSHGRFKSIGSGGPTGKVAYQPKNGGFNPPDYFIGYFIAPDTVPAAKPAAKPAGSSSSTYTVRKGDTLSGIAAAHHATIAKLLSMNPPAADRKTKDYSIIHAGLILVGQKLHVP